MNVNARRVAQSMALTLVAALAGCATTSDTRSSTGQSLSRAQATLEHFRNDPEMGAFRDSVKKAKAVIISPSLKRAALVIGGQGGEAVMLARDEASGQWSGPAFYNLGAGSVGLQIGADVSEVVMLVMTEKALDGLLSRKFALGGDASIAAGPVGVGTSGSINTDVISFARTKGAYAGISLAGAVITPDDPANQAYYGRSVSPADILVRRSVSDPASASLQQALARMSG